MEPIRETAQAACELDPSAAPGGLLSHLTELANRAHQVVPDLLGVSIGRLEEGLTFTLVATTQEFAVLDAVQYAAGGPCVEGAHEDAVREYNVDDVLDEDSWRLFAEATAARTVRSTLTLPVLADGRVAGTVNLYAGSARAFVGQHEELADIFGAWAAGAVANADLSFATRREAEKAPGRARQRVTIDVAVGILAARLEIAVDDAERRLREAAGLAGVALAELAATIVELQGRQDHGDR